MMKNAKKVWVAALVFNSAFSGAFLFIAVVIVPFWSSLNPASINEWYATYFWRFPTVMVPLNLLTFISIAVSAYRAYKHKIATKNLWYAALLTILLCSLTYPVIFDDANRTMMALNANLQEVETSFGKWVTWHWIRTLLSFISLVLIIFINVRSTNGV